METQDTESLFYFKVVPAIAANKNRIIAVLGAIVLVIFVVLFFSWQKDQKEINAGQAFSQIWVTVQPGVNPSQVAAQYLKIATDYADTQTGQRALLQGATSYFQAGNYTDAQAQFQKFADANPNSSLVATALLGVASSLEAQGKSADALTAYHKVLDTTTDAAAQLSAKFATGRLLEQQGKGADALRFYEEIARTAPNSSLGQQASLKGTELAATLPKPAPISTVPPAKTITLTPPAK